MHEEFESSSALATYRWGSLVIRISQLQPADDDSLLRIITGLGGGFATWRTPGEFRLTVALIHESVHLLQDLTTGVGHFDSVLRHNINNDLLRRCADLSTSQHLFPSNDPELHRMRENYLTRARYVRTAVPHREEAIRRHVASNTDYSEENIDISPLLIESVVEAEAALATYLALSFELKMSSEQREIAISERALFDILEMPNVYRDLFIHFADIFVDRASWANTARAQIFALGHVFLQLIDWALAHPSPRLMFSAELSEPGIRLRQLITAVRALSEEDTRRFILALSNSSLDVHGAEMLLKKHIDGFYMESQFIYRDWEDALRAIQEATGKDNEIVEARLHATRWRLTGRRRFALKLPMLAAECGFPLHYLTPKGVRGFKLIPDHTRIRRFWQDWLNDNSDIAWSDCFLKTGVFRCPHVDFSVCSAATADCRKGIRSLHILPDESVCEQRRTLRQWFGFSL
ncbi:hypothetical protein [Nannocystis sp. SCPEA4]|uniref:hypothetical protein n=1 Tax=Nannocystis sp. SCPEA4 TaxID=2996787 RepID=UPI00226F63C1|nr:hypothetical protein [Nannocystis sp. SCPEA4]MCY1058933.1 hypothetical protein [Nannocystis sp. SCPEA4]